MKETKKRQFKRVCRKKNKFFKKTRVKIGKKSCQGYSHLNINAPEKFYIKQELLHLVFIKKK